ncbi:hypothetical protein D3C80_255700 [compost metagenome]
MKLNLIVLVAGFFLLQTLPVEAQQTFVKVLPESTVKLKGRTSIGGYSFTYKGDMVRAFKIGANSTNEQLISAFGDLQLEIEKFTSGNFLMNRDFRKLLKSKEHPICKIEVISISPKPGANEMPWQNGLSKVSVTIAGVKKTYLIPYKGESSTCGLRFKALQQINLRDFGLNPSDANRLVEIKDNCEVELCLVLQVTEEKK